MKTTSIMPELVGKTYKEVVEALNFESDDGDCCGYGNVEVTDMVQKVQNNETAVLVKVLQIDYDDDDCNRVVINFVFNLGDECGLILGYDLLAGSGSGWAYGAYCILNYNKTTVASVSY